MTQLEGLWWAKFKINGACPTSLQRINEMSSSYKSPGRQRNQCVQSYIFSPSLAALRLPSSLPAMSNYGVITFLTRRLKTLPNTP